MKNQSNINPINDQNSNCFKCNAGMCEMCSGEAREWYINNYDPIDFPEKEPEPEKEDVTICTNCGMEYIGNDFFEKAIPAIESVSLWGFPTGNITAYKCCECYVIDKFKTERRNIKNPWR